MTTDFKKYVTRKEVHGRPMTRGDYNQYRGWTIPDDEDPDDQGYLVVYYRGTDWHYESWCPKDQFEDSAEEI